MNQCFNHMDRYWGTQTKHTLAFNCSNTRQDKTKAHDPHIDIGEGALARCRVRRVLIMSKVRRNTDTQVRKVSMNYV